MHINPDHIVSGKSVSLDSKNIYELFSKIVPIRSNHTAIEYEGKEINYRQLQQLVNDIAGGLIELIKTPPLHIACCLGRSIEQIAVLLAILKTGNICVPIDPLQPKERLAKMYQIAECKLLITSNTFRTSNAPPKCDIHTVDELIQSGQNNNTTSNSICSHTDKAFIYFTSGSSGSPKGVWLSQAAAINALNWRRDLYDVQNSDIFFYKAQVGFDISLWEIFLPLLNGATVSIARPLGQVDIPYLIDTIYKNKISVIQFVGSMLRNFIEAISNQIKDNSIRVILCGGENWDSVLANRVMYLLPNIRLFNVYGQTETSLGVLAYECHRGQIPEKLPLDIPSYNTKIVFIDEHQKSTSKKADSGELCVGGIQVSNGYHSNPQANQKSFFTYTLNGVSEKFYKTGDFFILNEQGQFIFLGRQDNQIKINGVRIELEEIENVINTLEGITGSCAVIADKAAGSLAIFIVKHGNISETNIKKHIRQQLPPVMIPRIIKFIDELPLTKNGKLDRETLLKQIIST